MLKRLSPCLLAFAVLGAAPAFAEKVVATIKVSTKAMGVTGYSTGNIANHEAYQQSNHESAFKSLQAEAQRLHAATPGATRHELVITKVKHDVMWSHATDGLLSHGNDKNKNERFTTAKMSGTVTIYGN